MAKTQRARKLTGSAAAAAGRGVAASVLSFLTRHRCDLVQGFYYGEPFAPKAFAKLLAKGKRRSKRA